MFARAGAPIAFRRRRPGGFAPRRRCLRTSSAWENACRTAARSSSHDVLEGHIEIPEGLDSGVSEDLVVPGSAVHGAGREVELPTAHASRLQCDLQELCGIDRPGFHEAL